MKNQHKELEKSKNENLQLQEMVATKDRQLLSLEASKEALEAKQKEERTKLVSKPDSGFLVASWLNPALVA
jgi:hypothetical protein